MSNNKELNDERLAEMDNFADAPDVTLSAKDIVTLDLEELFDYRKGQQFCGRDAKIYWPDGKFDEEQWKFELDERIKEFKCYNRELINAIQGKIGYCFANEFLLLQAFTRRSYAVENGLDASSEVLEFLGDKVLDYVMIRTMAKQFTELDTTEKTPFISQFDEGELTKIKSKYVCKEYLSERAKILGLDKFIYYGKSDAESDNSREDMMEALLGAVAVDCNWDYDVLEELVETWLDIHYDSPSIFLETDPYDRLNSWYQRKYGCIPDYKVEHLKNGYYRCLVFIHGHEDRNDELIDAIAESRSKAKSKAAEDAYRYLKREGLWSNLSDSGIEPEYEKSVNQLQELYQKKYIEETQFSFSEEFGLWKCDCSSGLTKVFQYGRNKIEAKKRAAYWLLIELFRSSGIKKKEWDDVITSQRKEYFQWLDEMKKGTFSKGVKQTCNGCLGLHYVGRMECEEGRCPLGYQYNAKEERPLESCPRPKSHNKLAEVVAANGIELPVPEGVVVIPANPQKVREEQLKAEVHEKEIIDKLKNMISDMTPEDAEKQGVKKELYEATKKERGK